MKMKYRRFDDNDYTEIEVNNFSFHKVLYTQKDETVLEWLDKKDNIHSVLNISEVYLEEI